MHRREGLDRIQGGRGITVLRRGRYRRTSFPEIAFGCQNDIFGGFATIDSFSKHLIDPAGLIRNPLI
jgi:hypothetical protein